MNFGQAWRYFLLYWGGLFEKWPSFIQPLILLLFFLSLITFGLGMEGVFYFFLRIIATFLAFYALLLSLFLPFSCLSAFIFAYVSGKYQWTLSDEAFRKKLEEVFVNSSIGLSFGLIFLILFSLTAFQIDIYKNNGVLALILALIILIFLSFCAAVFVGSFLGYYADIVAKHMLKEKIKAKPKKNLSIETIRENNKLDEVETKDKGKSVS